MFDNLGESVRLMFGYAQQICQESQHHYIGTEHLFLGLAQIEDNSINQLFEAAALEISEVCSKIREEIGTGDGPVSNRIFATPRTNRVLQIARKEALDFGHPKIEVPHVLLGIIEDGEGVAARVLIDMGADLDKLANNMRYILKAGLWPAGFYKQKTALQQPDLGKISALLQKLGRDLTALAEQGELDPIVGRDKEIGEVLEVLCGRRKNNPILIGEAGVGKTAIVEGLAQRIVENNVPPELQGKHIRTIEIGALVSRTAYRGQFEERLQEIIDEVRERPEIIIFIDEIHTLIGAGAAPGALDAANMLKAVLARGEFKCIGATTIEEYGKYFEKDSALERRFQPVHIGEPSEPDTVRILKGLRPKYEEFHDLQILDEALEAAVWMSTRYVNDRFLPDKAIDLVDRACSRKRMQCCVGLCNASALSKEEIAKLIKDKNEIGNKCIPLVGADDIARAVSDWTQIPIGKLTRRESEKLLMMEKELKQRIVGQERAVEAVSQIIRRARSGLADPTRPYGVFLFLGPTGVGKTELARALAEFLFDDENELVRLDMSEYMEKHSISRLIGSPPGYVGWEGGGQLTEAVRKRPYAVILLDEVEKAHPNVLNALLQVMEDGRMTDGLGRTVNFKNTVIIMTSNLGSRQIQEKATIGFKNSGSNKEISYSEIRQRVDRELKITFSPEFLNRIDDVVIFHPLDRTQLRRVASLLLNRIPMRVEVDEEVLDLLVNHGFDAAMGARPLRRTIEDLIVNPLSDRLLRGELAEGDTVRVKLKDRALEFAKFEPALEPQKAHS